MVLTAPLSSQPLHAIRVLISTCDWNLTKDNQSFESSCHWQFIPPNLFPGVLKEISGRDFKNDSSTSFNFNLNCTLILVQTIHIRHWQLFEVNWKEWQESGSIGKYPPSDLEICHSIDFASLGPGDCPWASPSGNLSGLGTLNHCLGKSLGPQLRGHFTRLHWAVLIGTGLYWTEVGCTR